MTRGMISAIVGAVMMTGCSLAPTVPVTKKQLFETNVYNYYLIKESPESVLAELNREGEVVLEAKMKDTPVYIKILATSLGLKVNVMDR